MKWIFRSVLTVLFLVAPSAYAQSHNITVTWVAPVVDSTHSAASSYNIYRGTTSGGETILAGGQPSSSLSFVDPSGTAGVTYYYYVTATNSFGTSAPSAEVSATFLGGGAPNVVTGIKAVAN